MSREFFGLSENFHQWVFVIPKWLMCLRWLETTCGCHFSANCDPKSLAELAEVSITETDARQQVGHVTLWLFEGLSSPVLLYLAASVRFPCQLDSVGQNWIGNRSGLSQPCGCFHSTDAGRWTSRQEGGARGAVAKQQEWSSILHFLVSVYC